MMLLAAEQLVSMPQGSNDLFYLGFRIFLILLLFMCGISTIYITGKRSSEQQKWLLLTLLGFFTTLMSYYLEVVSTDLDMMLLVVKVGHVAKALSTICFLKYISQYCNVNVPKVLMRGYYIYEAWTIANIIFAGCGDYFYKSYTILYKNTMPYFKADYGWVFYVHSYGLCAAIFIVLFMITHRMVKVNTQERKRLRFLFLTGLIPVMSYPVGLFANIPWLDFVPISFGCSAILLFIASKQHGLLDVVQSAKESIIENTKEGVIVVDNEYNVLYANSMAAELVENVLDYKTGEELERFRKLFVTEKSVLEKQKKIYEISVSDIYENTKLRGKMAWIFDVTEAQNYTKEILRLKDAAEQANQAKSAFLANMSHEIRTPMNAIIGFTELVIEQEKHEDIRDYMYDIRNSAKNLLHIINQILDISKIESGKTEMVEEEYYIQNLLEDVMAIITNQAEQKGLSCKTIIDDSLPSKVFGSDAEIREILINVLNNSVKYTKEGYIHLRVNYERREDDMAGLFFEIKDTGIGMRQEDVDRIYDRFRKFDSMKNQGIEGNGLGMYIVKSLVTKMDGTIDIQSVYGKGTTITIMIPQKIMDDSPIGEFEVKHREEEIERENFHAHAEILAVDDNQVNLKLISNLLAKYGIHPDLAEDGISAIKKVQQKKYDMILMDHMMPGMDGVQTMQEIKKMRKGAYQSLPIIVLTANAIAGVREKMLSLGFQDYISKPIDIAQLEHTLLRFLPGDRITYELGKQEQKPELLQEDKDWLAQNSVQMKHIKVSEGYDNCGGKLTDYKEILQFVEKQGDERIQELTKLLLEQDLENYTIQVHALKSTAYNIGAMELGDEAKALEAAGKQRDMDYIRQYADDLLMEYQIVLMEIRKCFQQKNLWNPTEIQQPDIITLADAEEILQNVQHMIEQFELDEAHDILKELLGCLKEAEERTKIQNIMDALERFDVEKAQNLLTKE